MSKLGLSRSRESQKLLIKEKNSDINSLGQDMMLLRVPDRIKEEKALVRGFFEDPSDFIIGSQSVSSLFSDEKSDRKV